MKVFVDRVRIPTMSTIGWGYGTTEEGERVIFVGDHRPMRDLGEAAFAAGQYDDEPPAAHVEDYQIIARGVVAEEMEAV